MLCDKKISQKYSVQKIFTKLQTTFQNKKKTYLNVMYFKQEKNMFKFNVFLIRFLLYVYTARI